jgi:hypothetical protein
MSPIKWSGRTVLLLVGPTTITRASCERRPGRRGAGVELSARTPRSVGLARASGPQENASQNSTLVLNPTTAASFAPPPALR